VDHVQSTERTEKLVWVVWGPVLLFTLPYPTVFTVTTVYHLSHPPIQDKSIVSNAHLNVNTHL